MKLIKLDTPTSELGYMYRYQDSYYDDGYRCLQFPIVKETECGYWIDTPFGWGNSRRWVAKDGKNNYAKTTKTAALHNYYYRKHRQVKLLEARLRRARNLEALAAVELGRRPSTVNLLEQWAAGWR